jgi:hypothetical protein
LGSYGCDESDLPTDEGGPPFFFLNEFVEDEWDFVDWEVVDWEVVDGGLAPRALMTRGSSVMVWPPAPPTPCALVAMVAMVEDARGCREWTRW